MSVSWMSRIHPMRKTSGRVLIQSRWEKLETESKWSLRRGKERENMERNWSKIHPHLRRLALRPLISFFREWEREREGERFKRTLFSILSYRRPDEPLQNSRSRAEIWAVERAQRWRSEKSLGGLRNSPVVLHNWQCSLSLSLSRRSFSLRMAELSSKTAKVTF